MSAGAGASHVLASRSLSSLRVGGEYPQIQSGPLEGLCVFGNPLPNSSLPLPSLEGQVEATVSPHKEVPEEPLPFSSYMDAADRVTHLDGHSGPSRETLQKADSIQLSGQMEQAPSQSQSEDRDRTNGQSPPTMVGPTVKRHEGSLNETIQCPVDPLYRRVQRGLGGSRGRPYGVRIVAGRVEKVANKLARARGHQKGSFSFQTSTSQQTCFSYVRQQDSCRLHKQVGGHQVQEVVCSSKDNPSLVCLSQYTDPLQTYCGDSECQSRLAQSQIPSDRIRMVSPSAGRTGDLRSMGSAPYRPIRDTGQLQASDIRLTFSRPDGLGLRCPDSHMVGNVGVRLPSHTVTSSDSQEDPGRIGGDSPSSSFLASKSLDNGAVGTQHRSPVASASVSNTVGSASVEHLSRKSPVLVSSRLETIAQGVRQEGFSEGVAQRVARGKLRGSSLNVYEGRWKIFADWCAKRKADPWKSSIQLIADFLLSLFEEGRLKVRTIEGYRAAISASLKLKGRQVGSDPYLSSLVASFYVDRPVERNVVPAWDLSLVLGALILSPFEAKDMSSVSLKHLTYKTVFLLSLASGARRGEIHALDLSRTRWVEDGREVVLRPHVGFMSKTHVARDPSTALAGFRIKSLAHDLDRSDPDRLLCPLRALRYYVDRTAKLRGGNRNLFIPIRGQSSKKKLSPNTISGWIKRCIVTAYEVAGSVEALRRLHSVRAHEVRALSASWDTLKNVAVADIVAACRWRAHTTFTSFYLRDMVEMEEKLLAFKLVPTASTSRL